MNVFGASILNSLRCGSPNRNCFLGVSRQVVSEGALEWLKKTKINPIMGAQVCNPVLHNNLVKRQRETAWEQESEKRRKERKEKANRKII